MTITTYDKLNNYEEISFIGGDTADLIFTTYDELGSLLTVVSGVWYLCQYGDFSRPVLTKTATLTDSHTLTVSLTPEDTKNLVKPPTNIISQCDVSNCIPFMGTLIFPSNTELLYSPNSIGVITDSVSAGWTRNVTNYTIDETQYTFSAYIQGSGNIILGWMTYTDDGVILTGEDCDFGDEITLTGDWVQYSYTFSYPASTETTISRHIGIFQYDEAGCEFYCDGIQLENGVSASPYIATSAIKGGKYIQQLFITDDDGYEFCPGQGTILILPSIPESKEYMEAPIINVSPSPIVKASITGRKSPTGVEE